MKKIVKRWKVGRRRIVGRAGVGGAAMPTDKRGNQDYNRGKRSSKRENSWKKDLKRTNHS